MLPFHCSILISELEAILLLLHAILSNDVTIAPYIALPRTRSCAVFIDNRTCLQMIDGRAYPKYAAVHSLIVAILATLNEIEQAQPDLSLLFIKIKSHVDKASHSGNHEKKGSSKTAPKDLESTRSSVPCF